MKEMVIVVTVMVVGDQVSFSEQCKWKGVGGMSIMMRSGSGTRGGGGVGYQKRGKLETPLPLPSPPRGG